MAEWLDYQKLTASIYADLEKNAVVTHDDKILGQDTGIYRQIDVSVKTTIANHNILVIVQTKHLRKPADINIVGEFAAVIKDVRASKGVLICSAGFTVKALKYGQELGIDLCSAHDTATPMWALNLKIPLLWIEPVLDVSVALELLPNKTNTEAIEINPNLKTWQISQDGGNSTSTLIEMLSAEWNAPSTPRIPSQQHKLSITCKNMELLLGDSFWCPIKSLAYVYTIHLKGWKGTFSFGQVRGLLNRGTGELHANIRLTEKDIPLCRDPSWQPLLNLATFETENPSRIRIELSAPPPENFEFDCPNFG